MPEPTITDRMADWIGRYTRLACPHCPMTLRFRAVTQTEEKRLRSQMADHINGHGQAD